MTDQCSTRAPGAPAIEVARVEPRNWERFRALRLAALVESPESFASTLTREQAFDEHEWRRRATRPATFLASRNGRDIGLAGVYEFDGVWTVMGMWVEPEARGTGAVEALMGACEKVAREAGATTLVLGVMEDNPRGQRAYRRLGFELTGARDHVRDGRDELWMTKTLDAPQT